MTPGKAHKRKSESNLLPTSKKSKTPEIFGVDGFHTFSLDDITAKLQGLCHQVPEIPRDQFGIRHADSGDNTAETSNTYDIGDDVELDEAGLRKWASTMHAILEEFNLLVCCVETATYKWGTDRSGAADQNLNLLNGELGSSQKDFSTRVTPRLSNVLAPDYDLVIEKIVVTKDAEGREVKENHFGRKLADPNFLKLSHQVLARNAPLLRQVVLSNFSKLLRAIKDYLKAQRNDTNNSQSFTY